MEGRLPLRRLTRCFREPARRNILEWDEAVWAPRRGRPERQNATSIVARVAQDMLNTPEKERGSIISTARGFLSLWRDETVAKNTATSDFKIKDLMDAGDHRPVSLYIITNPTDKDRLLPPDTYPHQHDLSPLGPDDGART